MTNYFLRILSNIYNLPRINDAIGSNVQTLNAEISLLKEEIIRIRNLHDAGQEQVEQLGRNIRLMNSRMVDLADTLRQKASHTTKKNTKQVTEVTEASLASTLLADDHTLDQFYIEFENKFRGSEADIRQRLEVYLPYLKKLDTNIKTPSILDIGCGRGEFLTLMREHKIAARGLDLNCSMVKRVQEQGLDAVQANATHYLRNQPSGSLAVITGFHVVEHLPFAALLQLMDECFRVLRPNGCVIFETPNPENLIVATNNFYSDPSHLSPIPPALLTFVMETRGFTNIEVKRLHPLENVPAIEDTFVRDITERLYGPADYAVIAQK